VEKVREKAVKMVRGLKSSEYRIAVELRKTFI